MAWEEINGRFQYVPDKIDDYMVTPEGEAYRGDPNNPEHVKAAALSLLRGAGMQPGSYNQGAGIGYSAIDALYASDPRFAQYFPNKQEVYQDVANLMGRQAAIDQAASSQYDFGKTLLGGASAAIGYLSGGFGLQDLISQLGSSGAVAPTVAEYGGAMPGVYSETVPLVTEGAVPTQVAGSYEEFYQPPTTGEYEGGLPQTETTYTDPLERMYQEGGPVNLPPEIPTEAPTGYPQMPPAQLPRPQDMPTETGGISFEDIINKYGKYGLTGLSFLRGEQLARQGRELAQRTERKYADLPIVGAATGTGTELLNLTKAGQLQPGVREALERDRRAALDIERQRAARSGTTDSSTHRTRLNQINAQFDLALQTALNNQLAQSIQLISGGSDALARAYSQGLNVSQRAGDIQARYLQLAANMLASRGV